MKNKQKLRASDLANRWFHKTKCKNCDGYTHNPKANRTIIDEKKEFCEHLFECIDCRAYMVRLEHYEKKYKLKP